LEGFEDYVADVNKL